jgi:putative Mn2+ efflux pump MntP
VGTIEIILIAFALSVDAFAVSMAVSAAGRVYGPRSAFRLAFHFGLFQFLMPVIGWAAGATLERLIASVDHWVAFVLLVAVGVRMLRAASRPKASTDHHDPSRGLLLLTLSTAVSVDALAVGLSLGMLRISIWTPGVIIGVVTASMSLLGILLGAKLHARFGRIAEFVGGLVLILIAIKIVVSHLGAP